MTYTTQDYRTFIRSTDHNGYDLVEVDEDHFELRCPWAIGLVTFWQVEDTDEIVELSIVRSADGEPSFFLHFQVGGREHAEQLFAEMVDALLALKAKQATKVLLACSSALTTTFFANRLNDAAQALSIPYAFSAASIDRIATESAGCAAILLAPQVAYRHREVSEKAGGVPVLDIPAKIYGAYETGACLSFVHDNLQGRSISAGITDTVDAAVTDINVLVVTSFYNVLQTRIVWRLYVAGTIFLQGSNMKRQLSLHDVEDVVEVVRATTDVRIDKLVITMPGILDDGVMQMSVHGFDRGFDVPAYFRERYPFDTTVINNVNAAALGWYSQQSRYRSVTLHSQPRGNLRGGQGMVTNGHVIQGNRGAAGEISMVLPVLLRSTGVGPPLAEGDRTALEDNEDQLANVWDMQTTLRAIALELATNIAVFAPEAIIIRSSLTPDVDEIRSEVAKLIPDHLIPDLIWVDSFDEFCLHGALLMGLGMGVG